MEVEHLEEDTTDHSTHSGTSSEETVEIAKQGLHEKAPHPSLGGYSYTRRKCLGIEKGRWRTEIEDVAREDSSYNYRIEFHLGGGLVPSVGSQRSS